MKNAYIPITLEGKQVGVAMIDNGRLLLHIRDGRLREKLWGSANNPGFTEVVLDAVTESDSQFTIYNNPESAR